MRHRTREALLVGFVHSFVAHAATLLAAPRGITVPFSFLF
jgi:hypothetical protein